MCYELSGQDRECGQTELTLNDRVGNRHAFWNQMTGVFAGACRILPQCGPKYTLKYSVAKTVE